MTKPPRTCVINLSIVLRTLGKLAEFIENEDKENIVNDDSDDLNRERVTKLFFFVLIEIIQKYDSRYGQCVGTMS